MAWGGVAHAISIDELNAKVDSYISTLSQNGEKLGETTGKVEQLEKTVGDLDVNGMKGDISNNTTKIEENTKAIEAEETDRKVADEALDERVTQNETDIATLQSRIENLNPEEVEKKVDEFKGKLTQIGEHEGQINQIYGQLDQGAYNEATDNKVLIDGSYTIGAAIKELDTNAGKLAIEMDNRTTTLVTAIQNNANTINKNTVTLQNNIETVNTMAKNGLDKANQKIDTNAGNIAQNKLDIAANKEAIKDEITAREAADTKLQENIDKEAAERKAADTKLQENITKEEAARKAADTTLQKNITKEENARIAGDQGLSDRIDQVETDTAKGIAKASALAALHPLDFDPSNKFAISAAGGFYKSEKSFALGAFYRPTQDVLFSIGTSVGSGDAAYNVGVTVKLGKSGKGKGTTDQNVAELYRMIGDLQRRIEQLEAGRR